ncbi:MAG: hypothetical protein HYU66_23270 [Armatimonadetes bacterium]|nr:hypothetical protein [Armatimonadota bacterium]
MRHLLLALALVTVAAGASYRYDMGPADAPVAPGYTQVTETSLWSDPAGFGWTARPSTSLYRNDPSNPWFADADTAVEYALYSDGVLSLEKNSFSFRVEPGRYALTVVIGDLALGEWRPGNSIWVNGNRIAENQTTAASVKAFTAAADAPDGRITVRFRAESQQKYVTVMAIAAEPVAPGADVPAAVTEYPRQKPTAADYQRNWIRLARLFSADWERARAELAAEGQDLSARIPRDPRREMFGWSLGSGAWERLEALAGPLDLSPILAVCREIGLDGFGTNSPKMIAQLHAAGLQHAVEGSAERYPLADMTGVTMNGLRDRDGQPVTRDGVWSNSAPEVAETFRQVWRERIGAAAEGASFFMIDEPRGMWYAGGQYGDDSPPADAAFRRWAGAQGYADLAAHGIPPRGRTLDFYRFYQWRLTTVPQFVADFVRETPVAGVTAAPGNGDAGPEQMNHNSYWPPAVAHHGMLAATWAYGEPAACKAYAETIRMASEHGGKCILVPPFWHTPLEDLPRSVAGLSALPDKVMPWHFRGVVNGPDRAAWMKAAWLVARLTHATADLTHTPEVYLWCPESIVYNDLVDLAATEAAQWTRTYHVLFDADVDYAVTNTLQVPAGATVLYTAARPVLDGAEVEALRGFLQRGGKLLMTADAPLEGPDGRPVENSPTAGVERLEQTPEALRQRLGRADGPRSDRPDVKTYRYRRGEQRAYLLNNTSLTAPAQVTPDGPSWDLLNAREVPAGRPVQLPPGGHALWERR